MNKYQEALDSMYDNYVYGAKQKEDSYFALQELVDKVPYYKELEDKAKPRKVIFDEMDLVFRCPECGGTSVKTGCTDYYGIWLDIKFTHCSDCDQKLNWSEYEPK